MRALVTRLRDDNSREKVLVEDWPQPPGPEGNEVKTRTIYSGITNGTEHNDLVGGNYANPAEALPAGKGYQNVGEVIEVGPQVSQLQLGDILYMSAGHFEYVVMAEDGLLIKLPEEVDPRQAALFGISSVAMRTCCNTDLRMGERVLIVGSGIIGQIAAQIGATMGARVTLCDIDSHRLAIARQIGTAEQVVDVSDSKWKEGIADGFFDVVIDFAGVPGMEDKLVKATKHGGRMALIGGRCEVNYSFNLGQNREITIKQNGHFDNTDLANLCRLVARGLVKIDPVIQDIVPVTQANAVYDTLRDTPNELYGTVFVW